MKTEHYMKLKHQDKIDTIDNCPLENINGDVELYRCVESPITENSFTPQAVLLKPKHQNNCMAWGLSLFKTLESANQTLNNLSKTKKIKYSKVAVGTLTDQDGVKNCNKKRKKHYTFYPNENLDLVSKFAIVENNENK